MIFPPLMIASIWMAVMFSSVITAILFVDLLKEQGYWPTQREVTESDVFRVVHHLLYDTRESIEKDIEEIIKQLKTENFHNLLEVKSNLKLYKTEILTTLDELIKAIEDEEANENGLNGP